MTPEGRKSLTLTDGLDQRFPPGGSATGVLGDAQELGEIMSNRTQRDAPP